MFTAVRCLDERIQGFLTRTGTGTGFDGVDGMEWMVEEVGWARQV